MGKRPGRKPGFTPSAKQLASLNRGYTTGPKINPLLSPPRPGQITDKGYVRLNHGANRGKFEHRAIMGALCLVRCFYPLNDRTDLPDGFTVEHVDHDKQHNCPNNLLLLQVEIHNHLSWCSWLNSAKPGFQFNPNSLSKPDTMERELAANADFTNSSTDPDAYHGEF